MKNSIPSLVLSSILSLSSGFASADIAEVNEKAFKNQKPTASYYRPDKSLFEFMVLDETAIVMGDIAVGKPSDVLQNGIGDLTVKLADDLENFGGSFSGKAAWAGATTWPNSVVPYVIDASSQADKSVILAGMELISSQTGVRFVKRNNQQNFIRIFKGEGCWSFIGRKGGQQNLSIGPGCAWKRTVAHELMHALGFLHEQSRADRDNYVRINFENIKDGRAGQFNKKGPITTTVGSYDFRSVMHYGHKAFSKNGKPTIESLNPNIPSAELGKSDGLTNKDVSAIRNKYGSGAVARVTAFGGCDFSGWSAKLPEGHHNLQYLQKHGFVNDQMSSFKVSPGWGIRLYKDVDWSGGNTKVMTGNKACMGSFNDTVSSLRVVPAGTTAVAGKSFYVKNLSTGKFLDILALKTQEESQVKLAEFNGGSNQQVHFQHLGQGVYRLNFSSSAEPLRVQDNSLADGATLVVGNAQTHGPINSDKFIVIEKDGVFQFVSMESNKVLKASLNIRTGKSVVSQSVEEGMNNTKWELLEI